MATPFFNPATADPARLTDPFPARGAPKDPIAVVADPRMDYFAPAVANPHFRVPASDPGRGRPTLPGGGK
jgi:hypothetical protein